MIGGRFSGYVFPQDVCQWKTVDIETIRQDKARESVKEWKKKLAILNGRSVPNWTEIRERHGEGNIESAREEYHSLAVVQDFRKSDYWWMEDEDWRDLGRSETEIVFKARAKAAVPFAVVHERQWLERGHMGWWACVSDEKPAELWERTVHRLYDSLDPQTWIAVIDAHI